MPDQAPKFSTRLWSQEVGIARAQWGAHEHVDAPLDPLPWQEVVYRFSSGREFYGKKNPYE